MLEITASWILLAAAVLVIGTAVFYIRRKVRFYANKLFGNLGILRMLCDLDVSQSPRSLSGCDSLLLPRILADFPDFDSVTAKTAVRHHLTALYADRKDFTIYNVVMSDYHASAIRKTIVFQAAVSWLEKGTTLQKRLVLHYSYRPHHQQENIAANCPNCCGVLGYGETVCPFCGSRVINISENTWEFTDVREG